MLGEIQDIIAAIKKLGTIWSIHRWEREAIKANRNYETYRARFALERIEELSRSL